MKTNILLIVALTMSAFASIAVADMPRESIFYGTDMDNISISAQFEREERLLTETTTGSEILFEADSGYGVLGYDLNPWLSVSIGLGQSKAQPEAMSTSVDRNDQKSMLMMAAEINVWQGDIYEPDYLMSRWRLQSHLSFWKRDSEIYGVNANWDELRADLILSIESFVTGMGENTSEVPYSLTFFGGAVYSSMTFDIDAGSIISSTTLNYDEKESMGLCGGADLKLHGNFLIGYEVRIYDEPSHTARISYHF